MATSFSLFEVLITIGITQGLVTAVLLLSDKGKQPSKRILGIGILVFCITNFRVIFHTLGFSQIASIRYLPLSPELFLPPLFYFYAVSLTQVQFKWMKMDRLHWIPGILFYGFDCLIFLSTITLGDVAAKDLRATTWGYNRLNAVEDILIAVSTVIYVILGYRHLHAYRQWLFELKLDHTYPIYTWLRNMVVLMSILAVLLSLNETLDVFVPKSVWSFPRWQIFNLFIAFLIYYLGFMGYKQENSTLYQAKLNLETMSKKLAARNIKALTHKLKHLIWHEHVYLDPDVSLQQLSTQMDTTAENLSFAINHDMQMSFRDLINTHRVEAVKKRLEHIDENNFSILDIAMDCGFNSQASFYRAFKKFTGMSPKSYLSAHQPSDHSQNMS